MPTIAIPKEIQPLEKRVSLVPAHLAELLKQNCQVHLESGAGHAAGYADEEYIGAKIIPNVRGLFNEADIILKVSPPTLEECRLFKPGSILISLLYPTWNSQVVDALKEQDITTFALDLIPRISRAQSMDVLSSQATVAGYKATLIAANLSERFFPMLTTAAGTIRPSKVVIIGAGVAGLQAIATAKRLGAVIEVFDVRSSVKEQVESLGARLIDTGIQADLQSGYARELTDAEKQQQAAVLADHLKQANVVISTALLPGKPAPKIISQSMVDAMQARSVVVDLAAEFGGNCVLTRPGETYEYQGVTISGPLQLPSMLARDASQMFSRNLSQFVKLIVSAERGIYCDWSDIILKESAVHIAQKIQENADAV